MKINKYQAESIAHKISEKAFEHLTTPAQAAIDNIALEAHSMFMANFTREQIDYLVGTTVLKPCNTFRIDLATGDGQDVSIVYQGDKKNKDFLTKEGWGNIRIINEALYERGVDANKTLNSLIDKRCNLNETIKGQISGKSPATMIKTWPEAEGIIRDVLGDICEGTMTKALEQLLARFLPMLPAPVGA